MTKSNPFLYFKTSPEVIRLTVMLYVRFPLSLRNVEDLLHEHGIDIRQKRVQRLKSYSNWRCHLDETHVKINGEIHYLWRAVDYE